MKVTEQEVARRALIADFVRGELASRNLSQKEFLEDVPIAGATFSRFMRGENARPFVYRAIEKALGIEGTKLFDYVLAGNHGAVDRMPKIDQLQKFHLVEGLCAIELAEGKRAEAEAQADTADAEAAKTGVEAVLRHGGTSKIPISSRRRRPQR